MPTSITTALQSHFVQRVVIILKDRAKSFQTSQRRLGTDQTKIGKDIWETSDWRYCTISFNDTIRFLR